MASNQNAVGGVVALEKATIYNSYFRREMWTGKYAQITVMSIPVGGEVGKEVHEDLDQILVVEQGSAAVFMAKEDGDLPFAGVATEGWAILVPSGTYHNIVNDGRMPLKMFSIYAPPKHPVGTLQRTKAEADAAEGE